MAYPPPPWQLKGQALVAVQPIEIDRARLFVPPLLQIVPIFPGKTLGGIYIASYEVGSTLEYNELIVVSALTYQESRVAPWISHIYVDHPDSMRGGRDIWGLPKELAHFTWQDQNLPSVQISENNRPLCSMNCRWQAPGLPVPLGSEVFSMLHSNLVSFAGQGQAELHWVNAEVRIPAESAIARLNFGRNWLTFHATSLNLKIKAPTPV